MEDTVIENNDDKNKTSKKIFIPAIGSLGDVKPYLILAKELKIRGHTVWLGVHKRFEDQVKSAGKNYFPKII
jgi:UDP:flavonoid glycosyltransferase YjiC (YdhE family)